MEQKPYQPIVFELCVESLEACQTGQASGVDRIELCSDLRVGGVSPERSLAVDVMSEIRVPIHMMLRPRAGDFVYSDAEFERICEDLRFAREVGASGVVFGMLHGDRTVDEERAALLVEMAGTMETTFHRAFDESPDLEEALERVIAAGCGRILTSGGAADAVAGAERLGRLVELADGRIQIAVGGGVRLENVLELARSTKARQFHGSLLRGGSSASGDRTVHGEDVRAMVRALRGIA